MENIFDINLEFTNNTSKKNIKGITSGTCSLLIQQIITGCEENTLIVTSDVQEALNLEQDLIYLLGKEKVWYFPDLETLPYDSFSPHKDIISRRLEIMYQLYTSI